MAADKFAKFLNHYTEGHVLFREGDAGDEMYICLLYTSPSPRD